MSAASQIEVLGRGRARWPVAAKVGAVALVLAGAGGAAAWYASAPPPLKPEPPQRRRDASAGQGAEFVPATAPVAPAPAPVSREEREPTPPPAFDPDPPASTAPAPPPIRLATMWGTSGLKTRPDDARRAAERGAGQGSLGERSGPGTSGEQSEFAQRMQTTRYAPTKPSPVRFNPTFTLAPDTKISCVPPSPISSEMVGPVSCRTQGDVRSMDGTMVLVPEGTSVHGMIERGLDGARGDRRLFMIWQYAVTPGPDWFMIPFDAPAADPMGQIGAPGDVDRRVWERYGPTLALSVIDFATGAATGLLRDAGGGGLINFGSIGGQAGRTLGQMAFERDQNIPKVLTRGPARTLVVYIPKPIDLSRYYGLSVTR